MHNHRPTIFSVLTLQSFHLSRKESSSSVISFVAMPKSTTKPTPRELKVRATSPYAPQPPKQQQEQEPTNDDAYYLLSVLGRLEHAGIESLRQAVLQGNLMMMPQVSEVWNTLCFMHGDLLLARREVEKLGNKINFLSQQFDKLTKANAQQCLAIVKLRAQLQDATASHKKEAAANDDDDTKDDARRFMDMLEEEEPTSPFSFCVVGKENNVVANNANNSNKKEGAPPV